MTILPRSDKSFTEYIEEKDRRKHKKIHLMILFIIILICVIIILAIPRLFRRHFGETDDKPLANSSSALIHNNQIEISDIPKYSGEPYYEINANKPFLDKNSFDTDKSFELYSELDGLGRCGTAIANLNRDLMPTEERGDIGMIRPSGWHTIKYPGIIDDLYLYNRCHLIAYSLAGENANERNLITGTRYFNIEGMLPFENQVRRYIEETNNHVLYRITPVFDGNDLVARGVLMEALSVEDQGEGVCFNVFVYNVQPGIVIDYSDGESWSETN